MTPRTLYIWNFTANSWQMVSSPTMYTSDALISGSINSGFTDFIVGSQLHIVSTSYNSMAMPMNHYTDFVEVKVFTESTSGTSAMEHLWEIDVQTNVDNTFYLEANWTDNGDGPSDTAQFYYSTTGLNPVGGDGWVYMMTASSSPDITQSYTDSTIDTYSGTLYIGAVDGNRDDAIGEVERHHLAHGEMVKIIGQYPGGFERDVQSTLGMNGAHFVPVGQPTDPTSH